MTKNSSNSETVSERNNASFEAISIALVKMPLLYDIITHGSKSRNELWERKRKFFSNFFLSLSPSTNVAVFFPLTKISLLSSFWRKRRINSNRREAYCEHEFSFGEPISIGKLGSSKSLSLLLVVLFQVISLQKM